MFKKLKHRIVPSTEIISWPPEERNIPVVREVLTVVRGTPIAGTNLAKVRRITDSEIHELLGPQGEYFVEMFARATELTSKEFDKFDASWNDGLEIPWAAATTPVLINSLHSKHLVAYEVARKSKRYQEWFCARGCSTDILSGPGSFALQAASVGLLVRDLIDENGLTWGDYADLVSAWTAIVGPVHPDDLHDISKWYESTATNELPSPEATMVSYEDRANQFAASAILLP